MALSRPLAVGRYRGQGFPTQRLTEPRLSPRLPLLAVHSLHPPARGACAAEGRFRGRGQTDLFFFYRGGGAAARAKALGGLKHDLGGLAPAGEGPAISHTAVPSVSSVGWKW